VNALGCIDTLMRQCKRTRSLQRLIESSFNTQLCLLQVKGFPNQSFKVGCSYQVEGKVCLHFSGIWCLFAEQEDS
jgi:hypothetical protein